MLADALNYIARGWYPIPVPIRSKAPRLAGWQNLRITADDAPKYFSGEGNIGINLGASGLIDIDLDCEKAVELAPKFLPPTPAIFGRASKPASHWIYQVTNPVSTRRESLPDKRVICEYRSVGAQTIFPNSSHQSGEPIVWQNSDGMPAAVDGAALAIAMAQLGDAVRTACGNLNFDATAVRPAEQMSAFDRCRAYLEKCPDAISGQGGHKQTLFAACECFRFGLSPDEAWMMLQWFNTTKCQPAWNTKDLLRKMNEGRKIVTKDGQLGERLTKSSIPDSDWHGASTVAANVPQIVSTGHREANLLSLDSVNPREVDWLWKNRIPTGRITLLVGRPGEGKSFLTTDMAARVSTGQSWPDGEACRQGDVILMSAEDDPADTIRPRMESANADLSRIKILQGHFTPEGNKLITLVDLDIVENALKQSPQCVLLIIDPVGSYLGGELNANSDNEVRAVLAPLADLAQRFGVAVLIVAHRRKGGGAFADDLAIGSRAFTGLARVVWHLQTDSENEDRKLFLAGKNNLAKRSKGLAFSIAGEPAAIQWEEGPVEITADEAMLKETRGDKHEIKSEVRDHCAKWLRNYLLRNDPVLYPKHSNEIQRAAKDNGYSRYLVPRQRFAWS